MRVTRIKDDITEVRIKNKNNTFLIEQLKFIGAVPTRESKIYTWFRFNSSMDDMHKYLGL